MSKGAVKQKEINKTIRAEDNWEPIGPTPMPEMSDLRRWDMRLMKTYKPFYAPFCDLCCFCTYGKCDLTEDKQVDVEAPHMRTVMGLKPETLGDLRKGIEFVERGIIHGVSATHMGQEGSDLDFESKSLHIGMLDHVAMEGGDVSHTCGI